MTTSGQHGILGIRQAKDWERAVYLAVAMFSMMVLMRAALESGLCLASRASTRERGSGHCAVEERNMEGFHQLFLPPPEVCVPPPSPTVRVRAWSRDSC